MKKFVCPLIEWVDQEVTSLNRIKPAVERIIELLGWRTVLDYLVEEDINLHEFVKVMNRTLLTCREIDFSRLVDLGFKSELNIEEEDAIEDPEWSYADEVVDDVYEEAFITVDDADEARRETARAEEKEPPIGGSYPAPDEMKKWNSILAAEGLKNF